MSDRILNGVMLAPTVTVVRCGSGRVPDGRQLVAESVVDRARRHGVYRCDVGGRSWLHCHLYDVVFRPLDAVHLRVDVSDVGQRVQHRSTQDLPLQPDKHTRSRHG